MFAIGDHDFADAVVLVLTGGDVFHQPFHAALGSILEVDMFGYQDYLHRLYRNGWLGWDMAPQGRIGR